MLSSSFIFYGNDHVVTIWEVHKMKVTIIVIKGKLPHVFFGDSELTPSERVQEEKRQYGTSIRPSQDTKRILGAVLPSAVLSGLGALFADTSSLHMIYFRVNNTLLSVNFSPILRTNSPEENAEILAGVIKELVRIRDTAPYVINMEI